MSGVLTWSAAVRFVALLLLGSLVHPFERILRDSEKWILSDSRKKCLAQ